MNDTLNAVIAFVGFLVLFSMLVTSIQDAIKNALKLKSRVWERFFINIYKNELSLKPRIDIKPKKIPTDFIGEFDKRLSRLKKIIMEANQLLKALKEALNNIVTIDMTAPDGQKKLKRNMEKISDSLMNLTGLNLKSLLSIYDKFIENNIGKFYEQIDQFAERVPVLEQSLSESMEGKIVDFKKACSKLLESINTFETNLSNYKIQIEKKADAWLEQLGQEYKRNMLKWTLLIGLAFVLVFNADSFKIFNYLLHDVDAQKTITQKAVNTVIVEQKSNAENLNSIQQSIGKGDHKATREPIKTLLRNMQTDYKNIGKKDRVVEIEKLQKEFAKLGENDSEAAEKTTALFNRIILLYANLQKETVNNRLESITSVDLPLGWMDDIDKFKALSGGSLFFSICKKIGGLGLTWLLITFGAPFWKDVLNALVGIKKTVSKKK